MDMKNSQQITREDEAKFKILFVDDESNILSALRRLLRPLRQELLFASSGAEGLELLAQHDVDLVISDMRMPEMDGAEFLSQVTNRWPDTIRILLTGYADISSIISAINEGNIYKYISKPWDDNDITLTIKRALELIKLRRERDRLTELTKKQNEELIDLNANLEKKVENRTQELRQMMDMLTVAYEDLKTSYSDAVKVFSVLIEMTGGAKIGHSRDVAGLAVKLAEIYGLSGADVQDIYFASLLQDVGRVGLNEELSAKSIDGMSENERSEYLQQLVVGEGLLMGLDPLKSAANIIHHLYEKFDGSGYPKALGGESIPLGARIIRIVSDYLSYSKGNEDAARKFMVSKRGVDYDPDVLDQFFEKIVGFDQETIVDEQILPAGKLSPGMVISRDLVTKNGLLLIPKGYQADEILISKILHLEKATGVSLGVPVLMK
ncbi:MAG: HD domain-containing phosphohydrolase [Gammaproteobacteria bacterium]